MKKVALVVFASSESSSQALALLACAACLKPQETELWLVNSSVDDAFAERAFLPVDAVCHIAAEGPKLVRSAEEWMPALLHVYKQRQPQAILFYATLAGNELATRTGLRTGGSSMLEISSVLPGDVSLEKKSLTVHRAAYGSNLTASFELRAEPYVLSIAKGAFDPLPLQDPKEALKKSPRRLIFTEKLPDAAWHTALSLQTEEAEEGLETAEVIVAGGRGVGQKENMEWMRELAALLNGKLGGTRPTVLDGWLKHKDLIGASGNVVRPKLCLTMGVSGAGPFMAGVEKAEVLVAVNNDPKSLIFKYCDLGLVEDCNAVARELKHLLAQKDKE